jgi:hypothetical protein
MAKRPIRFFNTTGPCDPDVHYMLPPADRLHGAQLHRYIEDSLYWMLHAPRQTGKTTFLLNWMRELNTVEKIAACYVSVERCQGMTDIDYAMENICTSIKTHAKKASIPFLPSIPSGTGGSKLNEILTDWAGLVAPKELVVLFDEVDVLEGDVMVNFLRQLRDGFATRGVGKFPVSIALVGMRDLKDYLVSAKGGQPVNPGSPFNIKQDSAVIGNFSKEDIVNLFAQRTDETGQQIKRSAIDYVWEQSKGQPWIVNSLFMRATLRILDSDDFQTVTLNHIKTAREQMILARETHLDSLAYRLKDPQVKNMMEKLLTGEPETGLVSSEGFRICSDLGLVAIVDQIPQIANPIYREVLAREISYSTQFAMPPSYQLRWQKADGTLDMDLLLKEFQKFWRRNSEVWESKSDYTEAFPHLLLMAFLQRITNGEGQIDREYAAGRGRMDLFIDFKGTQHIIEIKLIHDYETLNEVKSEGIEQVLSYRDKVGAKIPCYLLIFDRRSKDKKLPWEQRITWNVENNVTVIGC